MLLSLVLSSPALPQDDPATQGIRASLQPCFELSGCEAFKCLRKAVATDQPAADEAAGWLAGQSEQDDPCYLLNLGYIEHVRRNERAVDLLHRAADLYLAEGNYTLRAYAYEVAASYYRNTDRLSEAQESLEKAAVAAQISGNKEIATSLQVSIARLMYRQHKDLLVALRMFQNVEGSACEEPSRLCYDTQLSIALVYAALGEPAKAKLQFEETAAAAKASGYHRKELVARHNVASVSTHLWQPGKSARDEKNSIIEQLRHVQTVASTAGNSALETAALAMLARLSEDDQAALEHYQRCIDLAADDQRISIQAGCLQASAARLASEKPRQAERYFRQGEQLMLTTTDPWPWVWSARDRMSFHWANKSPNKAAELSEALLDDIEHLRSLQSDSTGSAAVFAVWTNPFHWLHGRLLESADGASRDNIAQALRILERQRARNLLDALEKAAAVPDIDPAVRTDWQNLHLRIVEIRRRLLDPELPADESISLLGDLQKLSEENNELLNRLGQNHPDLEVLNRDHFATLDQVQSTLRDDEALLSFQLAPWEDIYGQFAGGSWLTVVTADDARVYRLGDRHELEGSIRAFHSLNDTVPKAAEQHRKSATNLYKALLGEALSGLSDDISKLIIIPDGALFLLPFSTLRPAEDQPLLVESFQLSAAPSATLWRRWRETRPPHDDDLAPAFALAVPDVPSYAAVDDQSATAPLRDATAGLAALPHAPTEARSVAQYLNGSVLKIGDDATESAIKNEDLGQYRFLHFAAHAMVNANPDLSAILLNPGEDDGLLRFHEITELDLDGQIVVLSACRTATGNYLRGEGMLSLSRAFFHAGAQAVVGSLWPVQDEHAAEFFKSFYYQVSRGRSVAEALRTTQRLFLDGGYSSKAWAGFVVIGDGDYVPFPGGQKQPRNPWLTASAILLSTVVVTQLWRRRP